MADSSVRVNIKRQNSPESQPYWEEFELQWQPGMNVIIALTDSPQNYPVDNLDLHRQQSGN
jgi:succinate dehydrogenase / fumarate reductase iron-sulfur subunit